MSCRTSPENACGSTPHLPMRPFSMIPIHSRIMSDRNTSISLSMRFGISPRRGGAPTSSPQTAAIRFTRNSTWWRHACAKRAASFAHPQILSGQCGMHLRLQPRLCAAHHRRAAAHQQVRVLQIPQRTSPGAEAYKGGTPSAIPGVVTAFISTSVFPQLSAVRYALSSPHHPFPG